jgi:hypothetical protein
MIAPEAIDHQPEVRVIANVGPTTRDLVTMGGIAAFRFQGGDGYVGDDLIFEPSPTPWTLIDRAVIMVSPNSFEHQSASNAGWAVDGFSYDINRQNDRIRLTVRIACWGRGAYLQRVAYHITALGVIRTA